MLLLRVLVAAAIAVVAFVILFFLLAFLASATGLTLPGAAELLLLAVVAAAAGWVASGRIPALRPAFRSGRDTSVKR